MTGRAALEGTDDSGAEAPTTFRRASGMIDIAPQSEAEMEAIRHAVVAREGILLSVFHVLRCIPRRVLMVLKLNDLTRLVQCHFSSSLTDLPTGALTIPLRPLTLMHVLLEFLPASTDVSPRSEYF